ncbi:MAG: hypothetical protein QOC99_1791 [Acidobacteriota bacterium]|nr:hypothetical protein [Acidobacteriota bacterium]
MLYALPHGRASASLPSCEEDTKGAKTISIFAPFVSSRLKHTLAQAHAVSVFVLNLSGLDAQNLLLLRLGKLIDLTDVVVCQLLDFGECVALCVLGNLLVLEHLSEAVV